MSEIETVLGAVDSLAPKIRALSAAAENERRLPQQLVDLMIDAGLFRILQPRAYGGLELDMLDVLDVIEAVSALDGSVGWCLLKGATTNQLASYLPEAGAREIWGQTNIVTAGSFNPKGRAKPVPGGYRLSGRWDWGTGATHSSWIMAGALIVDPATDALAAPPMARTFFLPHKDVQLIDTWRAHGMRGTGSVDFEINDAFVPEHRVFEGLTTKPTTQNGLTLVPLQAQVMVPHAAVALGLARRAWDAFLDLAVAKTPLMASAKLGDDRLVHDQLGRARAEIDSAKAYVRDSVSRAWKAASEGRGGPGAFAPMALSAVHATHACVSAVDRLYTLAGGSAVQETSSIQKAWRDLHVAASHFLVAHDKFSWTGAAAIAAQRVALSNRASQ